MSRELALEGGKFLDVLFGDNACQAALVNHRQLADVILLHKMHGIQNGIVSLYGYDIFLHPVFYEHDLSSALVQMCTLIRDLTFFNCTIHFNLAQSQAKSLFEFSLEILSTGCFGNQ